MFVPRHSLASNSDFHSLTSLASLSLTRQNISANIVSTFQAGAFGGALLGFPLMESFGRKMAMIVATVVFIVGAILQVVATNQLSYVYAGRALVCVSPSSYPSLLQRSRTESRPFLVVAAVSV